MPPRLPLLLCLSCLLLLTACASTNAPPADPIEGINRATFAFNDAADKVVVTPLAKGYRAVTPDFVRAGIANAFGNVADVGNAVNNLLQGKVGEALSDVGRVLVNSTIGVLGLHDVASPMGLEKHNEDFGQTLGKWGVPSGPYLVLPLLGPSTLRDGPARLVDQYWSYGKAIDHARTRNEVTGLDIVRIREELLATSKTLDDASLDRYQFLRDAYLQRRLNQVHDGKVPAAAREALEDALEVPASAPKTPPAK